MEDLIQTREISPEQLKNLADTGYLYAILDSCDEPLVPPKMQELGEEKALSLFKGGAQESYWAVAPYLAKVDAGLLAWIAENLDGTPWGIFVFSKTDLPALHKHFRHFLIVQLHDGKQWFFRFYDPRILTTYLPSCNAAELKQFFGPVRGFGVAAEEKMTVMEMAPEAGFDSGSAGGRTSAGVRESIAGEGSGGRQGGLSLVRSEQYVNLADRGFELRVEAHVRDRFPDKVANCDLRATVREYIGRGRLYGLIWESSLASFVALCFELGPDFHLHPHVNAILTDSEIAHGERIPMLLSALRPEEWQG